MTDRPPFHYTTTHPGFDFVYPLKENENIVPIYIGAGKTCLQLALQWQDYNKPEQVEFHFLLDPKAEVPPYFTYTGYSFNSEHHHELRINDVLYLYMDDAAHALFTGLLYKTHRSGKDLPIIGLDLYRDDRNPGNYLFRMTSSEPIPVVKTYNTNQDTNHLLLNTARALVRGILPIQTEWTDTPLQLFINARDDIFGSPEHIRYAREEWGRAEHYKYLQREEYQKKKENT